MRRVPHSHPRQFYAYRRSTAYGLHECLEDCPSRHLTHLHDGPKVHLSLTLMFRGKHTRRWFASTHVSEVGIDRTSPDGSIAKSVDTLDQLISNEV